MSDRFEDQVRQAAGRLADPTGGIPSYEGAYRRGLRRRNAKRAVAGGLGALLIAAALVIDVDRLPGGGDTSETDLAIAAAEAAPSVTDRPEALSTTSPVVVPTEPVVMSVPIPTRQAVSPTATTVVPPRLTPAPTSPPAIAAAPTAPPNLPPTPAPTATATAVPAPTAEPSPTAPAASLPLATPSPEDLTATGPQPTPDPSATVGAETPAALPAPADAFVDATFASVDGETPCSSMAAGEIDSLCQLFAPFSCTAGDIAPANYLGIDSNGDGFIDLCVSTVETVCDTNGDGVGDTPCEIRPIDG